MRYTQDLIEYPDERLCTLRSVILHGGCLTCEDRTSDIFSPAIESFRSLMNPVISA